jgi:hypothetical protein
VYVFSRTNRRWSQDQELAGLAFDEGDIALDGTTLVIGDAENSLTGTANVYVESGGTWGHRKNRLRSRSTSKYRCHVNPLRGAARSGVISSCRPVADGVAGGLMGSTTPVAGRCAGPWASGGFGDRGGAKAVGGWRL